MDIKFLAETHWTKLVVMFWKNKWIIVCIRVRGGNHFFTPINLKKRKLSCIFVL